MDLYICIRANAFGRPGEFFASEEEGSDFTKVTLNRIGRTRYEAISGFVVIPYEKLYQYVIPYGFEMRVAPTVKAFDLEKNAHDSIEQFRRDNEEIIEDELERRGKEANPTYTGRKE